MRVCPRCQSVYTSRLEWCVIDKSQLVDQSADPLIGTRIERYQILDTIGIGGLGRVYHAKHAFIDREYALKVLFGDFSIDPKFQERFRREAHSVSLIKHSNVVRVEDFGSTQQGLMFLAMELLRGPTLDAAIAQGPMEPERAARIIRQVLSGLSAAHELGFVHRDVKPQNIMLIEGVRERVKILDFGTVAMRRDASSEKRITLVGDLVGTPVYMAPEQCQDSNVGPTADLYAAGVILFEMLTGAPPFDGARSEIMLKHLMDPLPAVPPSAGLETIVTKLLEKDPRDRPQSAAAAIEMLEELRFDLASTSDLDPPLIDDSEVQLIGFDRPPSESDEFESMTVKEELGTRDGPTPEIVGARSDSDGEFYEPTRPPPLETTRTKEVDMTPFGDALRKTVVMRVRRSWLAKIIKWFGGS